MGLSRKLNLIIPMAGKGERFKKENYIDFKPFIKINNKFMFEYVTEKFPLEVKIWVITCRFLINENQKKFLKQKNIEVIYINSHKLGPAYSIYRASHKLPLNESFFVSYCDIDWSWDFSKISKKLNSDGIVFTHRGFHPHKLINNFSAYCKTQKNILLKIKEKESFTQNWLDEHLSIGVFYYKSGNEMISGITSLIKKNIRVTKEYFPSLIFNELIKKEKKILVEKLEYYIHWGVPEQLEDYIDWSKKIKKIKENKIDQKDNNEVVICMGGKSKRMQNLKKGNKAFINILNLPMFKFVASFFPHKKKSIIITKHLYKIKQRIFNEFDPIFLQRPTNSQIETIRESKSNLEKKKNFFLISCDALGFFNKSLFNKLSKKKESSVIIFVFKPSLVQKYSPNSHTYVSFNKKNKIVSINIKIKKKKNDLGLAGFFWFKDGLIFKKVSEIRNNNKNEILIDHFIKYILKKKTMIKALKLENYIHLGTINEYKEFIFWYEKFK